MSSVIARALLGLLLAAAGAVSALANPGAPPPLVLQEDHPAVDAWPAVRVLADPAATLDAADALARLAEFSAPEGAARNLGVQRHPVWLALQLRAGDGDGRWVFDLDYPVVNELQLYLFADGRLVSRQALGSTLPFEQRALRSRSLAAPLQLQPGQTYQLLVRVRTDSSMVLPIGLYKLGAYHEREAGRLLGQGLMFGLVLALLAYSLVNGLSLRSPLFAMYAGMLLGSAAFFLDFSGLGQQFLWSQRTGRLAMISPLSVLLSLAVGGHFVMRALETQLHSPVLHRCVWGLSAVAALLLALGLSGLLNYRQAQVLTTLIGPLTPALAIAAAWRRARRGERMGLYMVLGWGSYVAGAISMVCLLRGLVPANFWTLHLLQWSSLLEMLAWLRVLGLHIEAVRQDAERNAAAVRDLSTIAHTDALTGLPNRRGLDLALQAALARSSAQRQLAVFLIDLDGFKAVNDSLGHAAGDQLLVQVAQRLTHEVRRSDVVARLGGDEFVVLAEGLQGEAEAQVIGRKLLDAFAQPVPVDGQACRIGLTIGFALAPLDSANPAELMRMADAAMYEGKRQGRHRVRRGGAGVPAPA